MKVTTSMIARDLRLCGGLYKLLLSGTAKKKAGPEKPVKLRNTDSSKSTYNVYLTRKDGSKMRVMIRKPEKTSDLGVLWIHSGGYVTGMPEILDLSMAGKIVKQALVISPEYRLADRHPYPAALDDCYLTLEWMVGHATSLGIRADKIFVGGESAGGGLTAALCLLACDRGEINIACQMPLYPMLTNEVTDSQKDNNAPVWSEKQNKAAWSLYLDGVKDVSKYAVPLKETDFSGLPPAITFAGTIEPFYDETKEYVRKLREAGVPAAFREFEGCYHAFEMMVPHSKEAKAAVKFFMREFEYAAQHFEKKQPQ